LDYSHGSQTDSVCAPETLFSGVQHRPSALPDPACRAMAKKRKKAPTKAAAPKPKGLGRTKRTPQHIGDVAAVAEQEYEVEAIVAAGKCSGLESYLVKWVGWGDKQNTWEPVAHLVGAEAAVRDFNVAARKLDEENLKHVNGLADERREQIAAQKQAAQERLEARLMASQAAAHSPEVINTRSFSASHHCALITALSSLTCHHCPLITALSSMRSDHCALITALRSLRSPHCALLTAL
jgi:hypothetical protein